MGFTDYVAARVLLNAKLLVEGNILASTAIEKYIKAMAIFRGNECRGHLARKHISLLRNFDPDLSSRLNNSFLEFLAKIYTMRYLDDLTPGFNLCISQRQTLAELDYTVAEIQSRFRISTAIGRVKLKYDHAVETMLPALVENNHLLQKITKKEFIEQIDLIKEIRLEPNMALVEVTYETDCGKNDGDFMREGLANKPRESNSRIKFQFRNTDGTAQLGRRGN